MDEKTTPNGQNPFNLIDQDIANQENTTQNVSATPTTSDAPVTNTTESNPVNTGATNANSVQKKDLFEEVVRKVAKFFAKLLGQPDPETWAPATSTTTTTNTQQPATNTENQWNTGNTENQKIDFNSVMSGVTGFMDKVWQSKIVWNMTGFLDKVWDKIEEKTGINLGTETTAPQETPATPAEPTTTEVAEAPAENPAPTQPAEPAQEQAPTATPETPTTTQQ